MIGSQAVMDEEFEEFLVKFHIAKEAVRRRKPIPKPVMDYLFEARALGIPLTAYENSARHSKANLEELMDRLLRNLSGNRELRRHPKTITTPEGEVQVQSYEANPQTNVLYVMSDVKKYESFWQKNIATVASQSETGNMDYQRYRIIVEHPDARRFRSERDYSRLSPEEKRRYDAGLNHQRFKGKKFRDLTPDEKERFYREFKVDYGDLTQTEQKEYRRKFQKLNEELVLGVAGRIAGMHGFSTIPIKPHFMNFGNISLRAQRQVIVNPNGERVLELEYLLRTSGEDDGVLFENALKSTAGKNYGYGKRTDGSAEYVDREGRSSVMVDKGDLLINFRTYGHVDFSIADLAARIAAKYHDAASRYDIIQAKKEAEKGKSKSKKEEDNPEPGRRETEILEAIRLRMGDMPLGFFIYAETTTNDLEAKYQGMGLDAGKIKVMFIKDRIGPHAVEGYQDAKFYVSDDLRFKQTTGEVQVMCPAMFHDYFTTARKPADKSAWLNQKARRSLLDTVRVEAKDVAFGSAFFGSGPESDNEFSKIYRNNYARAVAALGRQIVNIGDIGAESDRFQKLFSGIKEVYSEAKQRIGPHHLKRVTRTIDAILASYIQNKGMGAVYGSEGISMINEALKDAVLELDADFAHFIDPRGIARMLHERHIKMLFAAYARLAGSFDNYKPTSPDREKHDIVREVVASLFIGKLIKSYNEAYGRPLPAAMQSAYSRRVDEFCIDRGWEPIKLGKIGMAYVPPRLLQHGRIQDAIKEGLSFNAALTPFKEFDIRTLGEISKIYDRAAYGRG
ncbi:MAG TPA: hypothetical protein VJI52_03915 [Candidatus Nanoarchaeia archaeon]|nr:hypothetical protein [Candidatus Nanoarchaeia archaeon]